MVEIAESVQHYVERWPRDRSVGCMEYAARLLGLKCERVKLAIVKGKPEFEWLKITIGKRAYLYRDGILRVRRKGRFRYHWPHINNQLPQFTINKQAVKTHLREHGYSVPTGQMFAATQFEEALVFFRQLGRPVCIKPNNAFDGKGVFTPVRTESTFKVAFKSIAASYSQIIVEEHAEGDTIRFFYLKPYVVGVLHDRHASIRGDGHHTVAQLIDRLNQQRLNRQLPSHEPLAVDDELVLYLGEQGIRLSDVLAANRVVILRGAASAYYGGESRVCTDLIHPSYIRMFEAISATLPDLKLTAYDVIIRDIQAPAHPENYRILEMNSAPEVLRFYFPWEGETQDICSAMLDRMISGEW